MDVILSIKPEYISKIFDGIKTIELRKVIFKQKVGRVYIYATNPIKKIVGYFYIKNICYDTAANLGDKYKKYKNSIFRYFQNTKGYVIEISEIHKFDKFINPYDFYDKFIPPQNFIYIKK